MAALTVPANATDLPQMECAPTSVGLLIEAVSQILIPIVFGSISIFGILGNGVVMIVVWSQRSNRNTTDIFMLNLSVADFMVCLFIIPVTIIENAYKTQWLFGLAYCKIQKYLSQLSVYISIYTLVLMSLDRYLAVVHPFSSRAYRTVGNAVGLVIVLWAGVCLCAAPILLITHLNAHSVCDMHFFQYTPSGYTIYKNVFLFGAYVIPLAVISGLYAILIRTLWVKRNASMSAESVRGKKRVAKMVLLVVLLFAVCILPITVCLYLQDTAVWSGCNAGIFLFLNVSQVMLYFNSCCNPIVYCFSSEKFRESLFHIFPRLRFLSSAATTANPRPASAAAAQHNGTRQTAAASDRLRPGQSAC